MGKEHRGEEIAHWTDTLYLGSNVRVHPLHTEERDGHTVLTVAVDGDYAALGVTEPFQLDWHIDLTGDRIAAAHGRRETGPAGTRTRLCAGDEHVRSRRHDLALRAGRDRERSDAPLRGE